MPFFILLQINNTPEEVGYVFCGSLRVEGPNEDEISVESHPNGVSKGGSQDSSGYRGHFNDLGVGRMRLVGGSGDSV